MADIEADIVSRRFGPFASFSRCEPMSGLHPKLTVTADIEGRLLSARMRTTQSEQIESALAPIADI
jgi:hypothetical protein